jgi:hypothetical protein
MARVIIGSGFAQIYINGIKFRICINIHKWNPIPDLSNLYIALTIKQNSKRIRESRINIVEQLVSIRQKFQIKKYSKSKSNKKALKILVSKALYLFAVRTGRLFSTELPMKIDIIGFRILKFRFRIIHL